MKKKRILSWPALKKAIAQERRKRRKIVFTNGCFDLIHEGHLRVLEACKKKGDVLVVGLNSDASVRRLKGSKRPILAQAERSALMAGFRPVDYVVIFDQDTPQKLIELVQPDVVVKGGDWKKDDIVGRDVAKKVVRVPLVKGKSTTNIIRLIAGRFKDFGKK